MAQMWAAIRYAAVGLFIVTGTGSAQILRGTVVDSSGEAIAGAQVTVTSAAHSLSVLASPTGTFEARNVTPPATIKVRAAGFAATTARWNGEPQLSLTLSPAAADQQVIVTATRTAVLATDVAASVSRISTAQLRDRPALQLDDVLRQVPGFSLFRRTDSRTANPTSQGVSLRGLGASGASRALVLFDSVPLNDPFGGWVYWDRVPQTDIQSVEVLRGGGSALYGSGALAGVIYMLPREVDDRAIAMDLSGGGQSTADGSATLSGRFSGWGVGVSAQGMKTAGYIPVPESLRGRADALANVRFGTGRVTVDRNFSNATVFVSGDVFNESRQNGPVLQRNDTRLEEGTLGVDAAAAGGTLAVRTYISGQHFDQTFSSISLDRNTETLVRVQAVPAQQFGLSAVWNRSLGRNNALAMGTDVRRVTGHSAEVLWARNAPTGTVDAGGRQLYAGGFLEDMLRVAPRLHITAAARVDSWRNYDALSRSVTFSPATSTTTALSDRSSAALSPSLGAVFQLTRSVSLTGSAYAAFRSPTLNELYRAFRLGNVVTLANDSLHPERLRGVEGGVAVRLSPLSLRATYFWNTIHDAIGNRTLSTTPALITRQRQNIGDILARGVEIEVESRLPRHVLSRTAYEYSNAKVSRSLEAALLNLRVPQVPRHVVSQTLSYDWKRWGGTVVGRYNSLQFDDDLNQFALPGYFTADAMLRLRVTNSFEPYIACENLFDREYMAGRTPTPTLGSPRLLRAGVRLFWDRDHHAAP